MIVLNPATGEQRRYASFRELPSCGVMPGTAEVATGGVNSRGILNDTLGAADLGAIVQRSAMSATIPPGGNGSVTATAGRSSSS